MSAIDRTRSIRNLCEQPLAIFGRSCRKKCFFHVVYDSFLSPLAFSSQSDTLDLVVVCASQKIGSGNYFGCRIGLRRWEKKGWNGVFWILKVRSDRERGLWVDCCWIGSHELFTILDSLVCWILVIILR